MFLTIFPTPLKCLAKGHSRNILSLVSAVNWTSSLSCRMNGLSSKMARIKWSSPLSLTYLNVPDWFVIYCFLMPKNKVDYRSYLVELKPSWGIFPNAQLCITISCFFLKLTWINIWSLDWDMFHPVVNASLSKTHQGSSDWDLLALTELKHPKLWRRLIDVRENPEGLILELKSSRETDW